MHFPSASGFRSIRQCQCLSLIVLHKTFSAAENYCGFLVKYQFRRLANSTGAIRQENFFGQWTHFQSFVLLETKYKMNVHM